MDSGEYKKPTPPKGFAALVAAAEQQCNEAVFTVVQAPTSAPAIPCASYTPAILEHSDKVSNALVKALTQLDEIDDAAQQAFEMHKLKSPGAAHKFLTNRLKVQDLRLRLVEAHTSAVNALNRGGAEDAANSTRGNARCVDAALSGFSSTDVNAIRDILARRDTRKVIDMQRSPEKK